MIVFDAEPLVALYVDEPGSDTVVERIRAVESGDERGAINTVTCTEIHYVVSRDDSARAREYLTRIRNWLQVVRAESVWQDAATFKAQYGVPLGDAFTLATARHRDGTALVGADGDFDHVTEVEVERFRDGPA